MLNSPWTCDPANPPDRAAIGRLGEQIAGRWLYVHGCRILYRNYRAPGGGEVDLVCRDGGVLVFVEVKTRTSDRWGRPGQAVGPDKQALIVRGAEGWLRLLGAPEIPFRFDVVEVVLTPGFRPEVNRIRTAFNTDDLRRSLARRRH